MRIKALLVLTTLAATALPALMPASAQSGYRARSCAEAQQGNQVGAADELQVALQPVRGHGAVEALAQAGIFGIRGITAADAQPILAVHCPSVLFPYAREAVADATMRAGFPTAVAPAGTGFSTTAGA